MAREYRWNDTEYLVSSTSSADSVHVRIGDVTHEVQVLRRDRDRVVFVLNGDVHDATISSHGDIVEVGYRGRRFVLDDPEADAATGGASGADGASDGIIRTPMPGKVIETFVKEGDEVEAGTRLLILESMKMQNDVKAPYATVVRAVRAKAGENVDFGDVLVELDPPE